ncbi:hypothetical protein RDI58_005839 [Solanum bulbocastanum]|uniref:Uncharacterized protein n=1 Tax=Solanum bulbocastanum TaxID=147425 RepID=A0AAN8U9T5_SOLBU
MGVFNYTWQSFTLNGTETAGTSLALPVLLLGSISACLKCVKLYNAREVMLPQLTKIYPSSLAGMTMKYVKESV